MADGADLGGWRLEQPACETETRRHLKWLLEGTGSGEASFWADRLTDEFGTIGSLLAASPDRQAKAVSNNGAVLAQIGHFKAAMLHVLRYALFHGPVLPCSQEVHDYLSLTLASEVREQFRVLFLDGGNRLIKDELVASGTLDRAKVYKRELFGRAIELGAARMILVHNHPGGNPQPSAADVQLTQRLASLALQLDIEVLDHLLIAAGRVISLRQLGCFE